jgi:hypothetical protein
MRHRGVNLRSSEPRFHLVLHPAGMAGTQHAPRGRRLEDDNHGRPRTPSLPLTCRSSVRGSLMLAWPRLLARSGRFLRAMNVTIQ